MTSNKTKLAEASNKSAFDFDDDFDSFFDDDDLGGKKKTPIQEFMAGFKDGILDKGKNKSLLKSFLVNGAPKGYDRLFGVYDQTVSSVTSLKDHLEKTNPGDLQYLFKRAETLLPSLKDKVSETTYDRVNAALSNKVDQYKYQIEANQDQTRLAIRRQKAQDEEAIANALGEDLRSAVDQSTVVDRSLFAQGEASENRRWNLDRIERGLRDQADDKHKQYISRGLAQAVDSLTRMASYTEQVDYDFKRKGLELQFRSYQSLRDMAKLSEAQLEMQNKAFQALVRNTGLPDHLKSSMKDLMSMNMRQGIAQAGTSMVGRTLSSFLGNYGNNVQGRINNKASSTLSSIVQGMQTGESMSGFWDQRYNLAGGLAADGVHSLMRGTVAPMVGRLARPMMTRISDKYGKGKHNQVGYALDNLPQMAQDFVGNYQNSTGVKGLLQDAIRPFVPQFGLDTATKGSNYQTIGQHTAFNELSQRSLTEILPGFQARILRELRMLRTGKPAPMEVFDITKGVFTTQRQSLVNAQDRIVSRATAKMVSSQLSESLDTMDADNKLSKNARSVLSERLLRDSMNNKHFDPMRYGTKFGYKEGTDKETIKELETFFKEQFERDAEGKFADTKENHAKRKQFSDTFLNIRNVSRDPVQEIHRLVAAGKTDELRALGIIETIEGIDRINYNRIREMMSSDVADHGGPGKRYHDSDGDVDSRNFVGPRHPGKISAAGQNAIIKLLNGPGAKNAQDRIVNALDGPEAQRVKDIASAGKDKVKDVMDQFKGDPMRFMRDKFEAGTKAIQDRAGKISEAAKTAADVAKAGGLPAVLEHFSAKEKLDFAKALLDNVIDNEPPAMREHRLRLAQQIISSIDSGKAAVKDKVGEVQPKIKQLFDTSVSRIDTINIPEILNEHKNRIDQIDLKGHFGDAKEQGKALGDKAADKLGGALSSAQDSINKIKKVAQAAIADLYFPNSDKVAIKAIDIAQGNLVDVNTRKVIEKISDITGEVRNFANQQIVSAEEVTRGLYNDQDEILVKVKSKIDSIQNIITTTTASLSDEANKRSKELKDWCLEGTDEVIIKARDLMEGNLINAENGQPIYSLDDITGTIMDTGGRVVATAKELSNGLTSTDNVKFDLADVRSKVGKLASRMWRGNTSQNILSGMAMAGKFAWNLARNTASRILGDRDAYLPGKEKPVLTVERLKEGKYLNPKQKPYLSFGDINDTVIDADTGEPIVTKDELKDLLENNGSKHKIAKNRGLGRRIFNNTIGKAAKGYLNLSKAYYRQLGKEFGNDALAGVKTFGQQALVPLGSFSKRQLSNLSTSDQVLVQIRDAIRETIPKKQRKGSWMEKAEKAAETDKDKKDDKKEKKESTGIMGKMTTMIGGLWEKLKGKKDEKKKEEEELSAKDMIDGATAAKDAGGLAKAGWGLAKKAGTWLAGTSVGGLALRAAAWAAPALATLVSAPVLIGVGAVAAVGTAGYFGYKYFSGVRGEFMSIRMLQYGITSTRQRHKVLKLEQLMEKTALRGQNPQMNIGAAGGKAILEIMDIDVKDEANIHKFARWMDLRFKPVFAQWLRGLDTIGKTQMSLTDIEDKLDDALKGALVKEITTTYGEGSPFAMRDNPFGDTDPLDDTTEDVKEAISELTEKYKVDPDKEKAALPGKKAEEKKEEPKPADVAKGAVAGAAATAVATVEKSNTDSKEASEITKQQQKVASELKSKIDSMAKAAAVGVVVPTSFDNTMAVRIVAQEVPALDAVRARAYGLETLDRTMVEALMTMENSYAKQSKPDQSGRYKFTGNFDYYSMAVGGLLGMKTADHGPERTKVVNWLNNRFFPVAEAFITATRQTYSGKISDASNRLALPEQVKVANAIIGTVNKDGASIWSVPSVFDVVGKLEELQNLADADVEHIKKLANTTVASPTQSAGAQAAGAVAAASGKGFWSSAVDTVSNAFSEATDTVGKVAEKTGTALSNAATSVKEYFTGGNSTSSDSTSAPKTSGTDSSGAAGQTYGYIQPGNGGNWEQVPMPTSKDAKGSRATMEAVSKMVGVPVEYLMIFCAMESGFDWTIKAGAGGSATGWFQFINSTWDYVLQLYSKKYGIPPDSGRRLRLDPRINALMGAEYMLLSMNTIRSKVGKEPTDIDIYLAHFLGPGTAVKWLRMPKNTIGSSAFPKEARANPSIFKNSRTLGQIEKSFDDRMNKFRQMAAAGGSNGTPVPLKTEDVEKKAAEEKAKLAEQEAKADDPTTGVKPISTGPAPTGSTPTNTESTGGAAPTNATASTAPAGASTAPASVSTEPAPVAAPVPAPTPAPVSDNPSTQNAQAASNARDAQRAKEVEQSVKNDTAIMNVNEQQLQVQREILAEIRAFRSQPQNNTGNTMPQQQQTRSANKSPYPVDV